MKTKKRPAVKQSKANPPINEKTLGISLYKLIRPELAEVGRQLGWFDDDSDLPEDEIGDYETDTEFLLSKLLEDSYYQKQLANFVKPHAAKLIGADPDRFNLEFWRLVKGSHNRIVGSIEYQVVLKP